MAEPGEWVLFAYRLPREPSTPRIALWRKLRALGVAQLLDGLVALPSDSRNRERLEWLADEVIQAGGTADLWLARPASPSQQRTLAAGMAEAVAAEYRTVAAAAVDARGEPEAVRGRALRRLRRALGRVRQRDYFPPAEREQAQRAVEALAAALEVAE